MRTILSAVAVSLLAAGPLAAQVPTPARPVTDPASVVSPTRPPVRPLPIEDIGTTRGLYRSIWSADGKQIFLSTNLTGRFNLWRIDAAGSFPVQLTQSDDAQFGQVATRDGKWLLFEQDSGGNEYADILRVPTDGGPVENLTNTPERGETGMKVSPAGDLIALSTKLKSEGQTNLAVMTPDGKVRNLTREADPQYNWSAVAWTADGKALIANRATIDDSTGEVWRVEIADGKATLLLGKAETFYGAAGATADGRLISVLSDDGGGQMKAGVYDSTAKSWRWLKPTPWEQLAGPFTPDGKAMLFRINGDGRSTIYRVDLATMTETALTLPPGVNRIGTDLPFSPDGGTLLVTHQAANTPTNLYAYDLSSGASRPVTQLAMASLSADALPTSTVVAYKSFDGTLISAVVTLPPNLKRDGKNPAIVMPHGGPAGQSMDGFSQYAAAFASRGYIVIQPNFRGSTGYGEAFQTANFKDLGGGDLKDTIAAKHFLVATGYVDPKRVGIFGGSYGGFMTLMAIGKAPDEFAAGVQWFGIINWRTMYSDMDESLKAYLRTLIGTPESDPAAYDAASPLTYIRKAKAPLLTIQGENDIRVPRGQAQEVHDILKAQGNVVETVFYPAEGHGFEKRENQLDSLKRTVAWFDKYLKPNP